MIKRVLVGIALASSAVFSVGCGGGSDKPEIPTKMIEPPPPDAEGVSSSGGGKSKKPPVKHSDTGDSGAAVDM